MLFGRNRVTVLFAVLLSCSSCEMLPGVAGGAAATVALQSWQADLQARQAELQEQYEQALAALEQAPDPNSIQAAKQNLAALETEQTANAAALLAIGAVLQYPGDAGIEQRRNFWLSVLAGGAGIAFQAYAKRRQGLKYTSMKAAQAELKIINPDVARQYYAEVGKQRAARGLSFG